jgi:hypothetical protein
VRRKKRVGVKELWLETGSREQGVCEKYVWLRESWIGNVQGNKIAWEEACVL